MASNGEVKNQNEAGRHQEVGHKSLLQSDALYQVMLQLVLFLLTINYYYQIKILKDGGLH